MLSCESAPRAKIVKFTTREWPPTEMITLWIERTQPGLGYVTVTQLADKSKYKIWWEKKGNRLPCRGGRGEEFIIRAGSGIEQIEQIS